MPRLPDCCPGCVWCGHRRRRAARSPNFIPEPRPPLCTTMSDQPYRALSATGCPPLRTRSWPRCSSWLTRARLFRRRGSRVGSRPSWGNVRQMYRRHCSELGVVRGAGRRRVQRAPATTGRASKRAASTPTTANPPTAQTAAAQQPAITPQKDPYMRASHTCCMVQHAVSMCLGIVEAPRHAYMYSAHGHSGTVFDTSLPSLLIDSVSRVSGHDRIGSYIVPPSSASSRSRRFVGTAI